MPKAVPDQVIVHRIEFQESERKMLQDLTTVWSFNRVLDPLVRLINDNTTLLLILTALAGWLGFKYIAPELEDAYNQIVEFEEQARQAYEAGTIFKERVDLVGSAIQRGPLWGLVDLLEGYYGVNLPDFGTGTEPSGSSSSGGGGGF
ncbi:MAG TPA: hypothetical protein EYO33_17170 [Phycisphaerales bacterium]|nr:hypothetical protein [Phycisphaerales bacterium]